MAVTRHTYAGFMESLLTGSFSFQGFSPNVALFTDQYTPDLDNDRSFFDVTNYEPTDDPGYVSASVSNIGFTYDAPLKTLTINVSGTASFTIAADIRYGIVYDSYQGILVGLIDFGENINGQIDIDFPNGLVAFTRS